MTSAGPLHRELASTLTGLWHKQTADGCEVVTQASMPAEARVNAGAPESVVVKLVVSGKRLDWEVVWLNKRPTRCCP